VDLTRARDFGEVEMGDGWVERVAGTYYADATTRRPTVGEWLEPVREPGNVHDRNAISLRLDGEHVGYVARETAADFAPLMDVGAELHVKVVDTAPRGQIYVEYSGEVAAAAMLAPVTGRRA
jgi:hypothetical protein